MSEYLIKVKTVADKGSVNKMADDIDRKFQKTALKFGKSIQQSVTAIKWMHTLKMGKRTISSLMGFLRAKYDEELDRQERGRKVLGDSLTKAEKEQNAAQLYNADVAQVKRIGYQGVSAGMTQDETFSALNAYQSKIKAARSGEDSTLANFTKYESDIQGFAALMESLGNIKDDKKRRETIETLGLGDTAKIDKLTKSEWGNYKDVNEALGDNYDSTSKQAAMQKNIMDKADYLRGITTDKAEYKAITPEKITLENKLRDADASANIKDIREFQAISDAAMENKQAADNLQNTIKDAITMITPLLSEIIKGLNWLITNVSPYIKSIVATIDKLSKINSVGDLIALLRGIKKDNGTESLSNYNEGKQ